MGNKSEQLNRIKRHYLIPALSFTWLYVGFVVTVYKHVNHWKRTGMPLQSNSVLTGERPLCIVIYLLIAMLHLKQHGITTAAVQDAQETRARYSHWSEDHNVFTSLWQLSWIASGWHSHQPFREREQLHFGCKPAVSQRNCGEALGWADCKSQCQPAVCC